MESLTPKFEEFNETDVREEIIAPLLRRLGYSSGTDNNIIREQSLRYAKSFLGRKNLSKDPDLRGVADYILEANRLVRWVVEAKAPAVPIGLEEIEQAWSYANHPEVRAVYFVLCNGHSFQVFQTNLSPNTSPILSLSYNELRENYTQLKDLLSPEAILRDHSQYMVDLSPPLGPGLRSVARISSGWIRYDRNNLSHRALNEIQIAIRCGAVQRDENGKLAVYLETLAPFRAFQELNERLGLTSFEMTSSDGNLSTDPTQPTEFVNSQTIVFPAGAKLLDINTWSEIVLPCNLECKTSTIARGILEKHVFSGRFLVSIQITGPQALVAEMEGPFHVDVS